MIERTASRHARSHNCNVGGVRHLRHSLDGTARFDPQVRSSMHRKLPITLITERASEPGPTRSARPDRKSYEIACRGTRVGEATDSPMESRSAIISEGSFSGRCIEILAKMLR